jgi:hypothetical protein
MVQVTAGGERSATVREWDDARATARPNKSQIPNYWAHANQLAWPQPKHFSVEPKTGWRLSCPMKRAVYIRCDGDAIARRAPLFRIQFAFMTCVALCRRQNEC